MTARVVVLAIAVTSLVLGACDGRTPVSPTAFSADATASLRELVAPAESVRPPFGTAASVDFSGCLEGSGDVRCFSASLPSPSTGISPAGVNDPAAPVNLAVTVIGNTVTLTWIAPADPIVGYIIEAGSISGAANLANFATGNPATAFSTGGVGGGTYFVRIRALTTAAVSPASNEVVVRLLLGDARADCLERQSCR